MLVQQNYVLLHFLDFAAPFKTLDFAPVGGGARTPRARLAHDPGRLLARPESLGSDTVYGRCGTRWPPYYSALEGELEDGPATGRAPGSPPERARGPD
jgi:hypothetical protein